MSLLQTEFTRRLGIRVPIICGAMFPCSNPELVAAASEAGGIGIIQPLSFVYVYKYDFRESLRTIKALTSKPVGMNVIVEKGSKVYEDRMRRWTEIALEEGVRFFVSALGNPSWIVDAAKSVGGFVYHNTTERKWAEKALACGVEGLICVNNRAGGHAGALSAEELYTELSSLKVPLICAGGIGCEKDFVKALQQGYAGVQMGTRFIATVECGAHESYKQAIVNASESDIVLTKKVTGIPLSVIQNDYVKAVGTEAGAISKFFLKNPRTRHWVRFLYSLQSAWKLKRSALQGASSKDYWQAGKSVAGVKKVEATNEIISRFAAAAAANDI